MTSILRTLPREIWQARSVRLAALAFSGAVTSTVANAQVAGGGGGGGGGLLQTLVTYIVNNFVFGVILLAVLAVGALLMFGRATMGIVLGIAVGALIMGNYQAIANVFNVGGG